MTLAACKSIIIVSDTFPTATQHHLEKTTMPLSPPMKHMLVLTAQITLFTFGWSIIAHVYRVSIIAWTFYALISYLRLNISSTSVR